MTNNEIVGLSTFCAAVAYAVSVALPLLRKSSPPKEPKDGWKKIIDIDENAETEYKADKERYSLSKIVETKGSKIEIK